MINFFSVFELFMSFQDHGKKVSFCTDSFTNHIFDEYDLMKNHQIFWLENKMNNIVE